MNTMNTMNTKVYLCTGCNQLFGIQKSLDLHYEYCVYYNYKKVTTYNYINNKCIEPIIKILYVISRYDLIDDNFIKIKDILNIIKYNNIQYIYNTLNNLKIDYISYNELMHVISKNVNITYNELNLLIVCYKQCQKNINNIF